MKTQRCTFIPEFKLKAASLVLDQGYSIALLMSDEFKPMR